MKRTAKTIQVACIGIALFFALPQAAVYADQIRIAVIDSGATAYVDTAVSFSALAADSDPLDHGTHVAKLIRDGFPTAQIYMLQVCERISGDLKPSREAVLSAIQWCIENDIDIVNMSLVTRYDEKIDEAISNASTSHGIVFVAAAGNKTLASRFAADKSGYMCRKAKPTEPAFPASNPHVISVGGLNQHGTVADYSDRTCDLYANGSILGQEGTSFACPRITAQIASLKAQNPTADKGLILSYLQ